MKPFIPKILSLFSIGCLAFSSTAMSAEQNQYNIDVWADNWFSAYIDGKPLLEDSIPITTERSFNAETHQFSASSPFVLAFMIKDFKENDTGLEYIASPRQQMGDGGFITQITDLKSGNVVAVSDASMRCKVIHKAPLDSNCAKVSNPIAGQGECQFTSEAEPASWQMPNFDDSAWQHATEYSVAQVRPKDGYDEIKWNANAKLIWTDDLEKDNTLLCRLVVDGKHTLPTTLNNTAHSHMHALFQHFHHVKTSEDSDYLNVESNGLPEHNMMVGITNWQQQVPLPQNYTGQNSWKIPLKPVLADEPMSTKDHFHKGAIAIAVDGVPIFTAMNNRGEYAADIGELDQWGGHSGRADDYHYHLVPEYLENVVGKGNPIAYALDGYPVYARTDKPLDKYLGRFNETGSYEYHATNYPPYLIAGLRGKVQVDSLANAPEDQIEPQAKSQPIRTDDYGPLKSAKITDFKKINDSSYSLEYTVNDKPHQVNYNWDEKGQYQFVYVDADGKESVETFQKNDQKQRPAPTNGAGKNPEPRPPANNQEPRKYCGDGLCDNTESNQQCPADCPDK
ncbi:YHYH protein [Thiothrix lacustris]|uniref:YHYH protein n=1 Tax=Thiothrix lacustris TaxID=525917 RepID=UPI0027E5199B|nr:YHYH protein [Thiothrix lacustris]WMP18759.1 YHYH protein [Thiothrix lacustris]